MYIRYAIPLSIPTAKGLRRLSVVVILVALLLPHAAAALTPAAVAEVIRELRLAPRDNAAREKQVIALFEQAGADPRRIATLPIPGTSAHNIRVIKPGSTKRVILVSAHYDFAGFGEGIIDNWSGISLVTNLYQALREVPTVHTFQFMGFAEEEKHLLGSRAYVGSIEPADIRTIDAMINLECLGVGRSAIWTNGSNVQLSRLLRDVAARQQLPLVNQKVEGVVTDTAPFQERGIRVLTLHSLESPTMRGYIHSPRDVWKNIEVGNFIDTYHLLLAFLMALDKE